MPLPDGQSSEPPEPFASVNRRWWQTESPASRRVCLGIGVTALLGLLAMILGGRRGLAYDEVFHLTTVKALFRLGLSREFLLGTPWSAPGPLYAFVQASAAPLTGLRPPGIRLVNFACVLGMLALLWRALRVRGVSRPVSVTLGILAAPMGWIVFGMALTEAPAMLCAAGSLWLTLLWQREEARPARRDALAVGAGLLLGTAVIGRQVYLVVLPAVALLARRGTWRATLLQLAAAAVLPAGLFAVWGGLTPPDMRFIGHGLRPHNAVICYANTGLTTLLLAPRFFNLRPRWAWGIAGTLLALNLVFGVYAHLPVSLTATRYVPVAVWPLMARAYGSALLAMGGLFLAAALKNLWERRADREWVFACTAVLALAMTPLKITHTWDVRYVAVTLPFLIVAVADGVRHDFWRASRLLLGVVLAAAVLHRTMQVTWDEENPPTMQKIFSLPQGED